ALAPSAVPSRSTAPRRRPAARPTLTVTATGQARPDRSGSRPTTPTTTNATGSAGSAEPAPRIPDPDERTEPPAPPKAGLSPPVREVGTKLGDTVATAGSGLARTLEPVSPPVATIVGETGKVAGDTVAAATEVVVGVLDGLLGP
ncbi:MAG: hypothetical protein M3417_09925, partial [Actinomycetota bacterium]|nr:hypothetical protein [Actinomycetota bacterium]